MVWVVFSSNGKMWMKHDETKCLSGSYKTAGTIQQGPKVIIAEHCDYSDSLDNTTTTTSLACEETRASKTSWCQTSHWPPAANARSKEVKGQLYNKNIMNVNMYAVISSKLPRTCTHQSIYQQKKLFKDKHHQRCVCACWRAVNPRAQQNHRWFIAPPWHPNDLRAAKKAKAK